MGWQLNSGPNPAGGQPDFTLETYGAARHYSGIRCVFRNGGVLPPAPDVTGRVEQQAAAAVREETRRGLADLAQRIAAEEKRRADLDAHLQRIAARRESPDLLAAKDLGAELGKLDEEAAVVRKHRGASDIALAELRRHRGTLEASRRDEIAQARRRLIDTFAAEAEQQVKAALDELARVAGPALDKLLAAVVAQQSLSAALRSAA